MTGAPLEVTIRLQANFLVRPIEELSIFQNVPRIFMPAMWFEQKFTMDAEMAQQIRIAVQIPWIGQLAGFISLVLGGVLIFTYMFISFLRSRTKPNRQQMEINLGDSKVGERLKKEGSPLLNQMTKPRIVQQKRAPTQ